MPQSKLEVSMFHPKYPANQGEAKKKYVKTLFFLKLIKPVKIWSEIAYYYPRKMLILFHALWKGFLWFLCCTNRNNYVVTNKKYASFAKLSYKVPIIFEKIFMHNCTS